MRATCAVLLAAVMPAALAGFAPARRLSGPLPAVPPLAVGWIEERVEVCVDANGRVDAVRLLRATSPDAPVVAPAVASWRFRPAVERGRRVASCVLTAALIRPPQLFDGPTLGTPPVDLATPSSQIPFVTAFVRPRYPPLAIGDGIVLVEVLVASDGEVRAANLVAGDPGFEDVSLTAARRWSFRPARRNGQPVDAFVYLIFGFRRPLS